MKKLTLFTIILSIGCYCNAQNYINGSFQLSNIKYFGINAEFEKTLKSKELIKKSKKGKEKVKSRQFLAFGNFGYYLNNNSHLSIFNTYGAKYQKLSRSQFYYNVGLGFGFNTNFLGETYRVNDDGIVEKKRLASRSYWAPQLQLAIGRQFKKFDRLDGIFLRQNIHYLLNYNYGSIPVFNTELGIRINLNTTKK